jgi:hypothetical protein
MTLHRRLLPSWGSFGLIKPLDCSNHQRGFLSALDMHQVEIYEVPQIIKRLMSPGSTKLESGAPNLS